MDRDLAFRAGVLRDFGATPSEVQELLAYNHNHFDLAALHNFDFASPEFPFLAVWEQYARVVADCGNIEPLAEFLVQLQFPVCAGISQSSDYQAATRRGLSTRGMPSASGLRLRAPRQCQVVIHKTAAGSIPLIIATEREDFVALIQAFTARNEPIHVPTSMGACIVAGYPNWHRIHLLHAQYKALGGDSWPEEFSRIQACKSLYQDQFIILSSGPYSGVYAQEMAMEEQEWLRVSLTIRREHECSHLFTRRVFLSMRNNLLDELIADYFGITLAIGRFRADWLLRFLGLESFPNARSDGRLHNYRGTPPLSDGAFMVLQRLVQRAAMKLEDFDTRHIKGTRDLSLQRIIFDALCGLTLEEMAAESNQEILTESLTRARKDLEVGKNSLAGRPVRRSEDAMNTEFLAQRPGGKST